MLERSRVWWKLGWAFLGIVAAACATPEMPVATPAPAPPVATGPSEPQASPAEQREKRLAEARALLAQAETDVQRARAKRALWMKAWVNLVGARQAMLAQDYDAAVARARLASEFAQLGLEQLAYPAVK